MPGNWPLCLVGAKQATGRNSPRWAASCIFSRFCCDEFIASVINDSVQPNLFLHAVQSLHQHQLQLPWWCCILAQPSHQPCRIDHGRRAAAQGPSRAQRFANDAKKPPPPPPKKTLAHPAAR